MSKIIEEKNTKGKLIDSIGDGPMAFIDLFNETEPELKIVL